MQAFWVSYCTDHLLEADRAELEAWVGRGFRAVTDFASAWTRVDLPAPVDGAALVGIRDRLRRYGYMEVTARQPAELPPSSVAAASESTPGL